jgi:quinol monooxygenase YgiN
MSTQVKTIGILTAGAGKGEALKALLNEMVAPSRAEPGNLRYELWRDQVDPNRFALDELYAHSAAVAAHRETPHLKIYLAGINDLADRTVFLLDPAQLG